MLAKERLRKIINDSGLTIKDFSIHIGVNYRTLQQYIAGDRSIGAAFLEKISEQMNVSASWILTGKGPQLLTEARAVEHPPVDTPDFISIPRHPMEAPPLPPDLARFLDLPEGASMAEAVQAIKARTTTALSRDEVAAMMRAETESLRDEIMSRFKSLTDAADTATRPNPDPDLLERLACVAATIFRDANVTLPPTSLTAEATIMFNDLVTRVSDVSDPDEIALAMPLVEYNLKRRLKDATADPGAGKHGA